MNPTEPPQVLVGTGIGFAVRRVMPAVGLCGAGCCFECGAEFTTGWLAKALVKERPGCQEQLRSPAARQHLHQPEPPQVLVGTGIGFAVWRFGCGAELTTGWLAEGAGERAAVLSRTTQVAGSAQHLHEPDRTAAGFGWDRYWFCGSAGYAGR